MSSYAEIASKIPLPVSRTHKARDSMESLGQIRRSPPRRDHFKSPSTMEESELISSEPTPSFDSLLEELGMGTIDVSTDTSETAAMFSDDEAAAILNGGKTRDLPGTKTQGEKRLPSNSPVVIHDDAGNELPRDLGNNSKELPRRNPRDSPDPTNGEWETINKRNRRSHKTSTPKTTQRAAAFEDPIRETSSKTTHQAKGIEWVFVTISTVARSAFPIGKVKQTVEKFHKYIGKDHCNGVYPPNFRMGPTIKMNKTQIAKAKYFTMPDIGDLIFQINHFNPFGPFGQNQKNEKNKRQPKLNKPRDSKNIGVVNGISTEHDLNDLKKTFSTKENKINNIERVTTKLGRITNSIKITFASAIAPLKIGSEILGFFNVEPLYHQLIRCNKCQRFGHTTKKCRAEKPRWLHCAKNHTHEECRRKNATICANCGSHEHGAAFSGCPVAVRYYNKIQNKNNIIKKEHRERIRAQKQNVSQKPSQETNKTNKENPKQTPQKTSTPKTPKQNRSEKQTTPLDLDKLKSEIILITTQFVLNKIGQTEDNKQNKTEIKKEIENFLKNLNNKETPKHDSTKTDSCNTRTPPTEPIAEAEADENIETIENQNAETTQIPQKSKNSETKNKTSKPITVNKENKTVTKPYNRTDFLKSNKKEAAN